MVQRENDGLFVSREDERHSKKLWVIIGAALIALLISGGALALYGTIAKQDETPTTIGTADTNNGYAGGRVQPGNEHTDANDETAEQPVETSPTDATTTESVKTYIKPLLDAHRPRATGGSHSGGSVVNAGGSGNSNQGGSEEPNTCDQSSTDQRLFSRFFSFSDASNETDLKRVPMEFNSEVKISADDSTLVTVVEGWVYVSRDGGATWQQRWDDDYYSTGAVVANDGATIIAVAPYYISDFDLGGYWLYRSDDYGVTWERITTLPDQPTNLFISDDGNVLTANYYGEDSYFGIHRSTDGGHTWNDVTIEPDNNVTLYGVSPDGESLAARIYSPPKRVSNPELLETDPAAIYLSDDGGENWTLRSVGNAGEYTYNNVVFSSDNQHIAISAYSTDQDTFATTSYIFTSTDAGATWNERNPVSNAYFSDVLMSHNGQTLLLVATDNDTGDSVFYRSSDGANNWNNLGAPLAGYNWYHTQMSASGGSYYAYGQSISNGSLKTFLSSDPANGWQALDYLSQSFDSSRIDLDPDAPGQQLTLDKMSTEHWSASFDVSTGKLQVMFDENDPPLDSMTVDYMIMPTAGCNNGSRIGTLFISYSPIQVD